MIGRPFEKGKSGNPGGRPKALFDITALARAHTVDAIQTLVHVMSDKRATAAAKVSAASAILDRGWGKAPMRITHDAESTEPNDDPRELAKALLVGFQRQIGEGPALIRLFAGPTVTSDDDKWIAV